LFGAEEVHGLVRFQAVAVTVAAGAAAGAVAVLRRTPSGPVLRAARVERRPEAAWPRVEGDMVEGDQAERAGFNKKVRAKWFQWHAGQTSTT
jgi:hypothetical protein